MKKSLLIAAFILGTIVAQARPYNHSVGVNLGSYNGISYKGYIRSMEHLVVQTDINFQASTTRGYLLSGSNGSQQSSTSFPKDAFDYFSVTASPNIMYQTEVANFSGATMNVFVGGGIELGAFWLHDFKLDPYCKINEHVIAGTEFCLTSVPLVIGLDFRPGVGEAVYIGDSVVGTRTFFDWGLSLSLRYAL